MCENTIVSDDLLFDFDNDNGLGLFRNVGMLTREEGEDVSFFVPLLSPAM